MYSMKIENYSAKELKKLFDAHISPNANVTTDLWKGYRPLMKEYNISQIESAHGLNFKALHTNTSSKIMDKNHLFMGE